MVCGFVVSPFKSEEIKNSSALAEGGKQRGVPLDMSPAGLPAALPAGPTPRIPEPLLCPAGKGRDRPQWTSRGNYDSSALLSYDEHFRLHL